MVSLKNFHYSQIKKQFWEKFLRVQFTPPPPPPPPSLLNLAKTCFTLTRSGYSFQSGSETPQASGD